MIRRVRPTFVATRGLITRRFRHLRQDTSRPAYLSAVRVHSQELVTAEIWESPFVGDFCYHGELWFPVQRTGPDPATASPCWVDTSSPCPHTTSSPDVVDASSVDLNRLKAGSDEYYALLDSGASHILLHESELPSDAK